MNCLQTATLPNKVSFPIDPMPSQLELASNKSHADQLKVKNIKSEGRSKKRNRKAKAADSLKNRKYLLRELNIQDYFLTSSLLNYLEPKPKQFEEDYQHPKETSKLKK